MIDTALLLRAAAEAAGAQQYPAPALYVVASPIGNLADLSLRALHLLSLVDAVACEDTRKSGLLLSRLGIDKPLTALHRHNERSAAAKVCERLARGERVACLSDAGTPGISDPGAVLVMLAAAQGYRIVPIPGPSSPTAAISVAGDAVAHGFVFQGFLPSKATLRRNALDRLCRCGDSVVLLEAPHRIEALATELGSRVPARRLTACRELTKQFEDVVTMAAGAFSGWLAFDADHRRGEFAIVLHAAPAGEAEPASAAPSIGASEALAMMMTALPLSRAVSLCADIYSTPRSELYRAALSLRGEPPDA